MSATPDQPTSPWFFLQRVCLALQRTPWPLAVALGMTAFFTPHPEWHGDLLAFRAYPEELWHPYWARWLFAALTLPSETLAYVLLSLASIAGLTFAAHTFGGKTWMLFLSFPFAWTLYYGQIDGLAVAGLALAWWAVRREKPLLAGAGLMLASIKPQLTLPLVVLFWWWSSPKWKTLLIPFAVLLLSVLQWGFWIPAWLAHLNTAGWLVSLSRNISLFPELGWWVALIWLPIGLIPLSKERKVIAFAAGTALSMPYFPLPSAVLLFSLPLPRIAWLIAQMPALGRFFDLDIYPLAKALPPTILVWLFFPILQERLRKFRQAQGAQTE